MISLFTKKNENKSVYYVKNNNIKMDALQDFMLKEIERLTKTIKEIDDKIYEEIFKYEIEHPKHECDPYVGFVEKKSAEYYYGGEDSSDVFENHLEEKENLIDELSKSLIE